MMGEKGKKRKKRGWDDTRGESEGTEMIFLEYRLVAQKTRDNDMRRRLNFLTREGRMCQDEEENKMR